MKEGPFIASVAALIGDPARANILTALMDGRALTASELAEAAGVALPTASGHLAKLVTAKLLMVHQQGRHRYFRLHGSDVAEALESLMGLAQRTGVVRVRTGPRDKALREARMCYDHIAGERGVALLSRLIEKRLLTKGEQPSLTDKGRNTFLNIGIDIDALERRRRPLCLYCLDWSERRHHLGGGLAAAILTRAMELGWVKRDEGRSLRFNSSTHSAFRLMFL
jgi:DNA-binding transcriptional ArsR family regulator